LACGAVPAGARRSLISNNAILLTPKDIEIKLR